MNQPPSPSLSSSPADNIIIKGARVHNLQNVSLMLPKNKLIVFTGVSGSGKSSLAFDTIFAEGQRRYIESLSPYARQFLGQMDRPEVDDIIGMAPAIAIDQRALSHNPRSTVGTLTEIYDYLRVLFARLGVVHCPKCHTKIQKLSLDEMLDIIEAQAREHGVTDVTILSPVVRGRKGEYYQLLYNFLSAGFTQAYIDGKKHDLHERVELSRYKIHHINIEIDRVLIRDRSRLAEAVESALHYGGGLVRVRVGREEILLSSKWSCPKDNFSFGEITPRLFSFNSPVGACVECGGLGKVGSELEKVCPSCGGERLKPETLAITLHKKNIAAITALTILEAYKFFVQYEETLAEKHRKIAENLLKEIKDRLHFLITVGLDYVTLNREAETLSGGEAQRIRLASQIGAKLSGVCYVLDEPTIGLHERDVEKLIKTLEALRDSHNTLIVVEHDDRTILASDYFVELGPGAGRHGGEVVLAGETAHLLNNSNAAQKSLTLEYLTGSKKISVPKKRRTAPRGAIKIKGASANNLKKINVEIPLQKLVCITGVSGSGKSSLLYDVLYENIYKIKNNDSLRNGNSLPVPQHLARGRQRVKRACLPAGRRWKGEKPSRVPPSKLNCAEISGAEYFDRVVMIDQSPIGRTPRSNPATYTGVFTPIREFFSSLDESRSRGYQPSRFSFNVRGGRCEACGGAGYNLVEMHFLPPVYVQCGVCHGSRFNRETLTVRYNKKNISEILRLTVEEALNFFSEFYSIADKLKVLNEVGLGYLQLGQSATTLSGGEAQRIKISRELTHRLGKRDLFLLDEPTVGLHYCDIEQLLAVFQKLVNKGNTVVVIEHNMQIIKCADYIIDLGPEGGERGGQIVAQGTPEQIAKRAHSYTGKYLKDYL